MVTAVIIEAYKKYIQVAKQDTIENIRRHSVATNVKKEYSLAQGSENLCFTNVYLEYNILL